MSASTSSVKDDLIALIRANGPVPVAEYMGRAAEAYYARQQPFGTAGDFITAPEISQMFGEMIAAWLVDLWLQMGRPEAVRLVELGPGMGTLSADIMRTCKAWPAFRDAVRLHLVETSERLRERQAEALKGIDVTWHDSTATLPDDLPCFIVANEFFDALPIHQFQKTGGAWRERLVGYDDAAQRFFFTAAAGEEEAGQAFPAAPDGSIFEMSPVSIAIVDDLAQRVARTGGAALLIDYGHTKPGFGDTLQALVKHAYADPLEDPGGRDITAHVDFGTLRTVAAQHAAVWGAVTQGAFLNAMGIALRAQKLAEHAMEEQRKGIMAALNRLTAPEQMGRLFKVMAMTAKEAIIEPAGFGAVDHEVSDD